MLFEAAALLTASLALVGVGGPVVVPEFSRVSVSASVHETVPARISDRQSDLGASPAWSQLEAQSTAAIDIDVATLRTMTGSNLLVGMSHLAVPELRRFAAEYPTRIDTLLTTPPEATVVSAWWTLLDPTQRDALTSATPRLVGNLDGVPLVQRSRANERYLDESLAEAKRALDSHSSDAEHSLASRQVAMLSQVQLALKPSDGGPKRSLILLDPSGSGRAAIALGNPDTADYIGYLVPGMNYLVEPQMVNWTTVADDVYREQRAVLAAQAQEPAASKTASVTHPITPASATGARLVAGYPDAAATTAKTVATIAWIGYEAPDLFSVGGRDRAIAGSSFLETSWAGVRASRGADQPFISVFAHSYGSTVSLMALANGSVQVDALVVVGSPGSEIQSADKLKVANGNVFVGKADWDPAVSSAFFGSDPGASSYGARALGVDGGTDAVTGAWLDGSLGHNAYFEPGSESLHNMALIGTDNADLATDGDE
ncbi:alpha/beta hydrolase [Cryobacterium sp. N22]|uniref:alpha/beta hydrolase n=1 Tax=Cryobacterium sp. N22 TaxID=2048290 RepID=UPI000CE548EE|nr:alpha/beta hydrolase [Cryobacterium sp. N22]